VAKRVPLQGDLFRAGKVRRFGSPSLRPQHPDSRRITRERKACRWAWPKLLRVLLSRAGRTCALAPQWPPSSVADNRARFLRCANIVPIIVFGQSSASKGLVCGCQEQLDLRFQRSGGLLALLL